MKLKDLSCPLTLGVGYVLSGDIAVPFVDLWTGFSFPVKGRETRRTTAATAVGSRARDNGHLLNSHQSCDWTLETDCF